MSITFPDGPHIVLLLKNFPNQTALEFSYNQTFQYAIPLPSHFFSNTAPESVQLMRPFTSPSIPFPYAVTKSPGSKEKWRELAKCVYSWLKDMAEERSTDEWRWAVNFFWISYVGSSPSFPFAAMDPSFGWDPKVVPLAGEYLYSKSSSVLLKQISDVEHDPMRPLSEWMDLRAHWLSKGVDARSFRRIRTKGL